MGLKIFTSLRGHNHEQSLSTLERLSITPVRPSTYPWGPGVARFNACSSPGCVSSHAANSESSISASTEGSELATMFSKSRCPEDVNLCCRKPLRATLTQSTPASVAVNLKFWPDADVPIPTSELAMLLDDPIVSGVGKFQRELPGPVTWG